jgi:hypothetical protein
MTNKSHVLRLMCCDNVDVDEIDVGGGKESEIHVSHPSDAAASLDTDSCPPGEAHEHG